MVKKYKPIFIKAAVYTLIVFMLGVLLGYVLEEQRTSYIEEKYQVLELKWQDARIQSMYFQNLDYDQCDLAIEGNLDFSDEIYELGKKIDDYEEVNALTGEMILEKKRHALLKTQFWLNSMILKDKCNSEFVNVVYFFKNDPSIEEKQKQYTQSDVLREIKEKYGRGVMLIPLPIDSDISMIEIFKKQYDINEVPTILINEENKLVGVHSFNEIEKAVKKDLDI